MNTLLTLLRPPANKPKPNTRFLRNIIKDTDSHNATLLAKEAADSRAKLESLKGDDHRRERASAVGGVDIRKRQLGDIKAILGGAKPESAKKRKRNDDDPMEETRRKARVINDRHRESEVRMKSRRVNTSSEDEQAEEEEQAKRRWKKELRNFGIEESKTSRRHRHKDSKRTDAHSDDERDRAGRRHERHRRDHSSDDGEGKDRSRDYKTTSRSRHHHRRHSRDEDLGNHGRVRRSSLDRGKQRNSPSPQRNSRSSARYIETTPKNPARTSDSDPLEEILGPMPSSSSAQVADVAEPVKRRGRGHATPCLSGSGIDSRFASDYNPSTDIIMEDETHRGDDWDQALEALRDRQKWMKKGADRLRAAGFSDADVQKWERSGEKSVEKSEADVQWAKAGESREWDQGKVVETIAASNREFGRLKD